MSSWISNFNLDTCCCGETHAHSVVNVSLIVFFFDMKISNFFGLPVKIFELSFFCRVHTEGTMEEQMHTAMSKFFQFQVLSNKN
jgi:hypothetical protein